MKNNEQEDNMSRMIMKNKVLKDVQIVSNKRKKNKEQEGNMSRMIINDKV